MSTSADNKRNEIVKRALTRERKNKYSQDVDKRIKIESGYGDCSGTVWYWYKKVVGIDIGANTEAQINSKLGAKVKLSITNGIPDESKLKKGDLLYFRGKDDSRTDGVGHVEMYIGNGQCFGHGSGIGGTVKNLNQYCKSRYNTKSTAKLKNKGLICAIRFINDGEEKGMTEQEKIKFNELVELVEKLTLSKERIYHYTKELPTWAMPTIQKLLNKGIYYGENEGDLNLPETLMRILVINDRAGLYDR